MKASPRSVKKEIATERARAKVADLHNKMEDERGGGASVVEAAQKLGLTAVTIDAVDRSGRLPDGQPVANIPRGLDVVAQAFNSDVGVDNDPIQFNGGYVWYDVLGITPSRERNLDEVKRPGRGEVARGPDLEPAARRRRPKWCRSSSTAASSPTKPRRRTRRSRPRPASSATPRCPACPPA